MRLLIPIFVLILSGCSTVYREIYYIQEDPVHWQDTVIYHPSHWHYVDQHRNWNCVEVESDTVIFDCYDTIRVPVLKEIYKRREFGIFRPDKSDYIQM
jgi:hypothetical protein